MICRGGMDDHKPLFWALAPAQRCIYIYDYIYTDRWIYYYHTLSCLTTGHVNVHTSHCIVPFASQACLFVYTFRLSSDISLLTVIPRLSSTPTCRGAILLYWEDLTEGMISMVFRSVVYPWIYSTCPGFGAVVYWYRLPSCNQTWLAEESSMRRWFPIATFHCQRGVLC